MTMAVTVLGGKKGWLFAALTVTCFLLALATAAATAQGQRTPHKQLLRHPPLAAEVALPLGGSRMLVGGTLNDGRSAMVVLRRDGSLDPHFADHGVLRFAGEAGPSFGPEEFGSQIAVDQKGRILFIGGIPGPVRRLLPNGTIDRSFAPRVRVHGHRVYLTSVAVQSDGKIVVGGSIQSPEKIDSPAVARVTEKGNPDPSFGENGSEVLAGDFRSERPRVVALAVGPRNEIFPVIGTWAEHAAIQRLGPRGGIVHSFGHRGTLIVGASGPGDSGLFAVRKIAVSSSGKLVVGSSVPINEERSDAVVAFRYLGNGRPDPSFGRNGHVVLATSVNASTGAVAVRPDGGIILSGDGFDKRGSYIFLAALSPDGDRESTIGPGGFAKTRVGPYSYAPALVLQRRTAVAIGYTEGDSEVSRTVLARFPLSQ